MELDILAGIVIGFKPSLWIVIVAALINILSDIAGQYENGLYTPLSLRIVSNEERSDSYVVRQTHEEKIIMIFLKRRIMF
ncbi:hypothetical protein ACVR0P_07265 [Streptococcus castoreus]|uniref:hypothetical protein n=1 Tax=Streptococcus castoreus TaxID=254786 RepID=UPI0004243772|nr:hypothetical protein [Streptococcus castoreus]